MNNVDLDIESVNIIASLAIQIYKLFEEGYTKQELQAIWDNIVNTTNTNFAILSADIEKKEAAQT